MRMHESTFVFQREREEEEEKGGSTRCAKRFVVAIAIFATPRSPPPSCVYFDDATAAARTNRPGVRLRATTFFAKINVPFEHAEFLYLCDA